MGGQIKRRKMKILSAVCVGLVTEVQAFATGQLIGEGFDCSRLSTLFMATPIKFNGRVLRPAPGKSKARVFDYIDINIPILVASAKSRQKVYKRNF
jgi:superfamily II DNA or RNA helicase